MSELRKDPIIDRWVIIATDRKNRPSDLPGSKPNTGTQFCPFCPGNEHITPPEVYALRPDGSLPNSSGWTIRVVPNKFAALKINTSITPSDEFFFQSIDGIGTHEIIIETPDHQAKIEELSESELTSCFLTFKQRILSLKRKPSAQHILIFKNYGKAAGATLTHSHYQLITLPIVPELILRKIEASKQHHQKTGIVYIVI